MRRNPHGHDRVARRASRRKSLAAQPYRLAVVDSGRNRHLDLFAGREPHALLGAARGFRERHRQACGNVGALRRSFGEVLGPAAAACAAEAAEHLAKNILEATAATATAARAAVESFRSEAEAFEDRLAAGAAAESAGTGSGATETRKLLEALLALGIDFAAVELRAFLFVAENLVRRVHFR